MTVPMRFYFRTLCENLTPLISDPATEPTAPPDGCKMVDWLDPQQYRRVVGMEFVSNMVASLTERTGIPAGILAETLTNGAALPVSFNWFHPGEHK